jgi:hypothetical protein
MDGSRKRTQGTIGKINQRKQFWKVQEEIGKSIETERINGYQELTG